MFLFPVFPYLFKYAVFESLCFVLSKVRTQRTLRADGIPNQTVHVKSASRWAFPVSEWFSDERHFGALLRLYDWSHQPVASAVFGYKKKRFEKKERKEKQIRGEF